MFTISQGAINQVLNDMKTGNDADYVASFFAARPDWQEDAATETDKTEEKKEEVKA